MVRPGHSIRPKYAPVAQLDRASDYGSEGLRFEFSRVRHLFRHFWPLASNHIPPKVTNKSPAKLVRLCVLGFYNQAHIKSIALENMMATFYNSQGSPIAYCEDEEHIYLFNGSPVAYFSGESVYGYNGSYLGWLQNGWIYDLSGRPLFHSETASGGPVRPVRQVSPVKAVRQVRPVKSVRAVRPVKPVRSLSWSPLSDEAFFGN